MPHGPVVCRASRSAQFPSVLEIFWIVKFVVRSLLWHVLGCFFLFHWVTSIIPLVVARELIALEMNSFHQVAIARDWVTSTHPPAFLSGAVIQQ